MNSFLIKKNFYSNALQLRKYFELQFENPHQANSKRFVWDYWYVENQYRHMRTPAYHYFPSKIYNSFHQKLVDWGRENLGCHDISPPWLSYYVEGHFQNLHADVPHGPWAYVYALSPMKQKFLGGETLILREETLDYWKNFSDQNHREFKSFFHLIDPHFNQLLVFDARFPHGVQMVKNICDPMDARLVIHGWFVEPRPYVQGVLKTNQVQKVLNPWVSELSNWMEDQPELLGTITLRLSVEKSGKIKQLKILTNTLIAPRDEFFAQKISGYIKRSLGDLSFPAARQNSFVTIPLIFK